MRFFCRGTDIHSSFIDCRVHGMELDTYGVAVTIVSQSPVNDFIRIYGW